MSNVLKTKPGFRCYLRRAIVRLEFRPNREGVDMKVPHEMKNRKWGISVALALLLAAFPALAQNQSTGSAGTVEPLPGYPVDPPAQSTDQSPDQSPATQSPADQSPADQPPPAQPPVAQPPVTQRPTESSQQPRPRPLPIAPPQATPQANQPVPAELTLPEGAIVPVRITGWLSSEQNHIGDTFSASLDQPLIVNGWVIARKGQTVVGRVTTVKKSGHFGSVSQLGVELTMFNLVDGQQVEVQTKLVQNSGRSTTGPDVAAVGATTGVGAAIGAAADGGYGAGLGAGIGAMAGLAGVMVSHGSPTIIRPETLLTFQLASPVTVNTVNSQVAFQPVRQSDYRGDQDAYASSDRPRRDRPALAYPPPPAYPYPYYPYSPYYYGGGYYPGPVIGLGFGFGPRYGYYRGFRR
jgi:hypothetical protein